jgi:hypothetical protein
VGGATLELLPEFLPQRDQFTSVSAGYTRELHEGGAQGFAQFLARRNDNLHDYNTASVFGGIDQPWQWGRYKVRATLFAGLLTLGGRLYQEQGQLQLKVFAPWALPEGVELAGVAGVAHVNYKTLTNFDANTEELRALLSYRNTDTQWQLSGGVQNDHATGARPGGDRRGWSLNVAAYHRLAERWQVEGEVARQDWRGQSAYAPILSDAIRRQHTLVARGALVYSFDEHHSLRMEARRVYNRENISIFQYDTSVLQLTWQWNGW